MHRQGEACILVYYQMHPDPEACIGMYWVLNFSRVKKCNAEIFFHIIWNYKMIWSKISAPIYRAGDLYNHVACPELQADAMRPPIVPQEVRQPRYLRSGNLNDCDTAAKKKRSSENSK